MAIGREEVHQNARRITGGATKKSRSNVARPSTISGGAKNMKDSGRMKKRKDGLSQGVGNAAGGNRGKREIGTMMGLPQEIGQRKVEATT